MCYNIYKKGGEPMKDSKQKELLKILAFLEKLIIRVISIVGWVKILIDIIHS